jgi:tRNA G10  N-methylase Trm11
VAHALLCLRGNVTLAGDLALSSRELARLLPGVALRQEALPEAWPAFRACAAYESRSEAALLPLAVDAVYTADLDAAQIGVLLARSTFLQQLFAVPADGERQAFVALAAEAPLLRRLAAAQRLFAGLTAQCLTELSSLIASKSAPADVAAVLRETLGALLGRPSGERAAAHAAALARRARASAYLTHDLHVYKAKFFPRLAHAALNLAGGAQPGGPVLDPYAGSGTTLLEASRLGMPSFGTDIDPLSVLIADAKLLLPVVSVAALRAPLDAGTFAETDPRGGETGQRIALPHWLGRKLTAEQATAVLDDANELAGAIGRLPAGAERTLARICLSDALTRKLHMRFLGTGVGRFALEVRRASVRALFLSRYTALCREAALSANVLPAYGLAPPAAAAVARADARALPLRTGSAGAVLTSPPYLPASSGRENYLISKAPSLLLLGLLDAGGVEQLNQRAAGSMGAAADPEQTSAGGLPLVGAAEAAGAGRQTAAAAAARLSLEERRLVDWLAADPLRAIKAEPVRRYFLHLRAALLELRRVLRSGGRAALVIGTRSTFYRFSTREPVYTVETAALLAEAAQALGFSVEDFIEIELDKGNRNARPRSLDSYSETILILRA